MNLYAHDLSVLDYNFGFSEPYGEPFSRHTVPSAISSTAFLNEDDDVYRPSWAVRNNREMPGGSPPNRRHDGSSPLPLGMDWSPPPQKWVLDFPFFFFFFFLILWVLPLLFIASVFEL